MTEINVEVVVDIYRKIKSQVKMIEYVAMETDSLIMRIGNGVLRANPCPLCGHKDCFTIYERNQSFHCFSCEGGGDVVHLEKKLHNWSGNHEAAVAMLKRYGLP